MNRFSQAAWLASLSLLSGSCNAQSAPKPVTKAQPKPAVTPAPSPRPSVGKFQLSRAPEQGGTARGIVPIGTRRLVVDGQDAGFSSDGKFIIGFGRDHAPSTTITAFLADGSNVTERLPVANWAWRIQSLPTLPHHSQPDAEFQARRPGELAQINAARQIVVSSEGWRQRFVWPAKGPITGVFGSQRIYAGQPGAPHNGTDIAGGTGTAVIAPADGVVILAAASPFTLEGNLLMINHGMGLTSTFLHLSRIDVRRGDAVRQGQLIGAIGSTGRATGPHLHWGMKWQDERIDPQRVVGGL